MMIERSEPAAATDDDLNFRDLAEALPSMVAVSEVDGRLVFVNERWLEYTRLSMEQMNADRASFVHPEDLARVQQARTRAVAASMPFEVDYRVRRHDGVYRWHAWHANPIRDGRGVVVRWIGTTTDIDDRRKMEDALRESEREFMRVIETTSEGVWRVGPDGRTVYVNECMAKMLGYEPQEMLGRPIWDFMDDEAKATSEEQFDRRRRGISDQFEHRLRHSDGTDVWVIVNATPVSASDGTFAGSFAMITNVTDRRHSEDALAESEARYRYLADVTPALITLGDAAGRIEYCNRHLLEYSGLTEAEIAGGKWSDVLHPDDLRERIDEWSRTLQRGRALEGEFRARRHDGVYRWHLGKLAPVRAPDGKLMMWIGVHIDIDDRKRAELAQAMLSRMGEALSSSLEYEETVQSAVRCAVPAFADFAAVYAKDEDGSIRRVSFAGDAADLAHHVINPNASTGAPRVMRTGEPELYPELTDDVLRDTASSEDHLVALRAAGFVSGIIVPIPARGEVLGAMSFSTVRQSGRVFGTRDLALAQEIARRVGLALENAQLYRDAQITLDELRRANAAKDEFLGLVSHELKTPITTIYGNAEVLQRQSKHLDDESRQAAIADMASEAERLHRIIDNLLVLARLERGQEIGSEPILLHRVAERLVDEHRKRFPFRRIELEAMAQDALVTGEPLYVEQVLRNLISNAEKYSPWDRRIDVVIERDDREVRARVLDRGSGIDPEDRERVFTPFYRSARTANRAGGVGIGLAVCKRLIEALGGRVWAEPREEGGSDIGFALPAVTDGD